jgi:tetratricopeptide (TPR) repeat protein/tRNA A-37 threonylcarbamoyl transferase component Bud32
MAESSLDPLEELRRLASRKADVDAARARARVGAGLFGEAIERVSIGRFTVLDRLGEGAMGVVFAAQDEELDRKIAVKLIRSEASTDSNVRPRMLREAKALARLSDPHVVQIYEIGEHQGQVYIAMELVEGLTLADWLAREQRSWRECVRMFREVGRGLAAAHAAGVIHRDFKPANVLIGNDGRPRVVDFGLAHLGVARLDDTSSDLRTASTAVDNRVTASRAVVGTPAYMAPEQFEQRPVDARTDQFAFCIALWEAVYRVPPFDRRSFEVLAAQVTEGALQVPASPPSLPGWLRAALRRGLETDPDRRWPSMAALLHALERGLDRARHVRRAAAVAGAITVVGVAIAIAMPTQQRCMPPTDRMAGVWDDTTRNAVQRAVQDTGVGYAADTWRLIDERITAYVDAWMQMHVEACEAARDGEQSAATLDRRMVCLDRRFAQVVADVRVLETIDARGVANAANIAAALPDLSECADVERLLARDTFAPPPEQAEAVEAMHARNAEIMAQEAVGSFAEALTGARELLADAEALGFAPMIATTRYTLGLMLEANGDFEGARTAFDRTRLEALEVGDQELVFNALNRLVFNAGLVHDDLDGALTLADVALATLRGIGRADSRDEAYLHDHVGSILTRKGDYAGALARHMRALELLRAQVPDGDRHLAIVHVNVGAALFYLDRFDEALEHYDAGLAVLERGLGAGHPDVAITHGNIGLALHTIGRSDEALEHHRESLRILLAALDEDHPDVADARGQLGWILDSVGQHEEALAEQRIALAALERALGRDHIKTASLHAALASTATHMGDLDEALVHARRELEIRLQQLGENHPDTALAHSHLAKVHLARGEHAEAEAGYRAALRIAEASSESSQLTMDIPLELGEVLIAQGRTREGIEMIEQSFAKQPDDGYAAFTLARAIGSSDPARAIELARKAIRTAPPKLVREIEAWLRERAVE